ncbi:MAG: type II toxin-antitoxin system RelE/ParE family toxin [Hyphomonadaceae bacterium]|nr:type II toxin-antitoxin system RelE/ParE family toxin [Hyphomonadaceae bacterium]
MQWDDRALADLEDIATYLAADSPNAARRVVGDIRAVALLLETSPLFGRKTSKPLVRKLVLFRRPYILTYAVEGDEVRILSVIHQRRNRH